MLGLHRFTRFDYWVYHLSHDPLDPPGTLGDIEHAWTLLTSLAQLVGGLGSRTFHHGLL